jgi:signal transduction histidine kinase
LLEENVYMRRELIANVSHDLRSPLASIRGYLEALLQKGDTLAPDKRHAYLEIAARQSEHLGTLISELFELAKLDYKGYQINPEPVQLGELAQDVLQKFQLAAEKRNIALQVEAHLDGAFVRADIGLIERALENLLENALKHTPPGGTVSVAVGRQDGRVVVQ